MSAKGYPRRGRLLGMLVAGVLLAPALSGGAAAQDGVPSGRVLSFDLGTSLAASDNPGFNHNPDGGGISATTSLHVGLRNETPLSSLAVDADLSILSHVTGKQADRNGVSRRGLRLGYTRDGAGSDLKLSAGASESRIDLLRPLGDFVDDAGNIVLPDDLDDLYGSGWRRQVGLDAALTLGRDAPIGATLRAGTSRLSYRDTSNPDLTDSRRIYADADLRFALTQVSRLDLGLRHERFRDDDGLRRTSSLRAGLVFDRPDGNFRALLGATDTEDGTRVTAEIGRLIERPWGSLDGRIGAVRLTSGRTTLAGGLQLAYELATGRISTSVERSATSNSDDDETMRTALLVGYEQALTDHSGLSLDLAYVHSRSTMAQLDTRQASFGVNYSHSLTRDVALSLGYSYRMRDGDNIGRSTENVVTLSLRRSFRFGL